MFKEAIAMPAAVVCPSCGYILMFEGVTHKQKYVIAECQNESCKEVNKKYKIELPRVVMTPHETGTATAAD